MNEEMVNAGDENINLLSFLIGNIKQPRHAQCDIWGMGSYITHNYRSKLQFWIILLHKSNMMNALVFKRFLLFNNTPKPTISFAK